MEWAGSPTRALSQVSADRVLTTGVGQRRDVTLAGGSKVVLNTQTALVSRERADRLELDLNSGEVLIDAPASRSTSAKTLRVVVAGAATVEATEGMFSVRRTAEGGCIVRVFGGGVTLLPDASSMSVSLRAGRSATLALGKLVMNGFSSAAAPRLLAWTQGKLIFDGDSLGDVVAEFNRYNREKIVIMDAALARFRIGGSYSATNPIGFARALERTFNIRAESVRSGGQGASVIVLTRRVDTKPTIRPSITRIT
jgi:transmembrane sensor